MNRNVGTQLLQNMFEASEYILKDRWSFGNVSDKKRLVSQTKKFTSSKPVICLVVTRPLAAKKISPELARPLQPPHRPQRRNSRTRRRRTFARSTWSRWIATGAPKRAANSRPRTSPTSRRTPRQATTAATTWRMNTAWSRRFWPRPRPWKS